MQKKKAGRAEGRYTPGQERIFMALRLDLPLRTETLELEIRNSLAGAPSPWEVAVCERLAIQYADMTRMDVRKRLFKDVNRALLAEAIGQVSSTTEFSSAGSRVAQAIRPGSWVLLRHHKHPRKVQAVVGNGRVCLLGVSGAKPLELVQVVLEKETVKVLGLA